MKPKNKRDELRECVGKVADADGEGYAPQSAKINVG